MRRYKSLRRSYRVAWPAVRLIAAGYFLLVLLRLPPDGFLEQNLIIWVPEKSANVLKGWTIESDIIFTTSTAFAASALIFWKSLVLGVARASTFERTSLRLLDLLWYVGSAVTLAVAVSSYQANWAKIQSVDLVAQRQDAATDESEALQGMQATCSRYHNASPIPSSDPVVALGVVVSNEFCDARLWAEDPFDEPPQKLCSRVQNLKILAAINPEHRQIRHSDIVLNAELYSVLAVAKRYCVDYSISVASSAALASLADVEHPTVDVSEPFDLLWYFRLFAGMIGYKLFRALVDAKDEIARAKVQHERR